MCNRFVDTSINPGKDSMLQQPPQPGAIEHLIRSEENCLVAGCHLGKGLAQVLGTAVSGLAQVR
jgi:hypothetical protein